MISNSGLWKDFPSGTVVKTELPLQGPQVRFLVGKLRSYRPHGMATERKKKFPVL